MNENNQIVPIRENVIAEKITEAKLVTWMEAFGVAKQLLPNEKKLFVEIATAYQLNPFKREIYCIAYGEGKDRKLSVITGYEVYLKRAERTGDLAGWNCATEGSVKEGNLRAIITIYRKSWNMPLVHEVDYCEYMQSKKDGTPTQFWSGKPKTMIKKVAMAQGFRLAFPDELGGMPYTADELPPQMTGQIVEAEIERPISPQRKSETRELNSEELAAKAEKAKKHKDALEAEEKAKAGKDTTEAPKSDPANPQAVPDGHKVAIGVVSHKSEPNKGGYVKYTLEGQQDDNGYDIGFSTNDPEIMETLDNRLESMQKAGIEYIVVKNGKYTNYNIVGLVAVEE